jgi:protein-S-isoprenylcysteine O-methyltransferase Ste14
VERSRLIVKAILATAIEVIVFAVLLFGSAGTLGWWQGWVYLGVIAAGTVASSLGLLSVDEGLLAERLRPPIQKDQSAADKVILPAIIGLFAGEVVLAPFDVFHLRVLREPDALPSALGLAGILGGWSIAYLGMRENAFAAPVVKHQSDRGQRVVDTGLYAFVRHPMYAGGMFFILGTPLWLGSTAATLLGVLCVLVLVARILAEERFLRRVLPGYDAYTLRVRYRLIPLVW